MDRPLKKAKVVTTAATAETTTTTTTAAAWQHYRNYLETGELDELQELLVLHDVVMMMKMAKEDKKDETIVKMPHNILDCETPFDFLTILVSMTYYQLASQSDNHDTVLKHLQSSLLYFPNNPATWSLGAQYARMAQLVSPTVVAQWYLTAANAAADICNVGLKALMNTNNLEMKEWIELLVLDGLVGVEYRLDNDENGSDDDDNASDQDDENEEDQDSQDDNDDDDDDGYFSCSAIESMSRFMAAMILSTLGEHDQVSHELQHFHLTHRLSPKVWTSTGLIPNTNLQDNVPCVFQGPVLPEAIYQRMCHIFRPDATYWKESDYAHHGYYSYFMDLVDEPTNLMEQVIFDHLLPLAQQQTTQTIVGAEWWVHTRPIQANLGHNLHFDTDEVLLAQNGTISHPVISSVLYLTGNNDTSRHGTSPAGSTIVLNQTPDSKNPATICYSCPPRDNTFLVFPGDMLHGVLPCPVAQDPSSLTTTTTTTLSTFSCKLTDMTWQSSSEHLNHPPDNECHVHRLTLMVGFWTRRVPDKMNQRTVYGPCGPLPMETSDWCRELSGIETTGSRNSTPPPRSESLHSISPVWELLVLPSPIEEDQPWLEIPQSLDHQFFVRDAAKCFREAMMEPTK